MARPRIVSASAHVSEKDGPQLQTTYRQHFDIVNILFLNGLCRFKGTNDWRLEQLLPLHPQ
jgi:hypothetical protein